MSGLNYKELRSFDAGTRPNNTQFDEGQLFFNYADQVIASQDSGGAIVEVANYKKPIGGGFIEQWTNTTTATGTTVQVLYKPGYVSVFKNGLRLQSSEYIATDGVQITIAAAVAGDTILVDSYDVDSGFAVTEVPAGSTMVTLPAATTKDCVWVYIGGRFSTAWTLSSTTQVTLGAPASAAVAVVSFNRETALVNTYNSSVAYGVGAVVAYKGILYKCTTAQAAGAFVEANWRAVPS
jgi:hypothetical protein